MMSVSHEMLKLVAPAPSALAMAGASAFSSWMSVGQSAFEALMLLFLSSVITFIYELVVTPGMSLIATSSQEGTTPVPSVSRSPPKNLNWFIAISPLATWKASPLPARRSGSGGGVGWPRARPAAAPQVEAGQGFFMRKFFFF